MSILWCLNITGKNTGTITLLGVVIECAVPGLRFRDNLAHVMSKWSRRLANTPLRNFPDYILPPDFKKTIFIFTNSSHRDI